MFTGIIQSVGHLRRLERRGGDVRLEIGTGKLDLSDVKGGDSIATNGVCLTVVGQGVDWFAADVSLETLSLTTLGNLSTGSPLNLEKSLGVTDRLGGHMVSGHVDGVGEVLSLGQDGRSWRYTLRAPDQLARYIARKGSICIDGVSLTVNRVEDLATGTEISINLIPHTLQATTLRRLAPGARVNLEIDLIARYLERMGQGVSASLR